MSKTKTTTNNVGNVLSLSATDCPPEGATAKQYEKYLDSLRSPAGLWDRGLGWISWLQGQALERLVKSDRCKRGTYTSALEKIGMKRGTAYNCRRIYNQFRESVARKRGYTDMLRDLGLASVDERADLIHDCDFDREEHAPKSPPTLGGNRKTKRHRITGTLANIAKQLQTYKTNGATKELALRNRQEMKTELVKIKHLAETLIAECETVTTRKTKAA